MVDITDEMANRRLAWLETQSLAWATIRNRRQHLLTLWHGANRDGLAGPNVRPLRRVKRVYVPPRAWKHEEVQSLLEVAPDLKGHYPGDRWYHAPDGAIKIPRATFWGLLIRLGWDTGLRLTDLFSLKPNQFDDGPTFQIIQHKTKRWHITKVNSETLRAVALARSPLAVNTCSRGTPRWNCCGASLWPLSARLDCAARSRRSGSRRRRTSRCDFPAAARLTWGTLAGWCMPITSTPCC